MRICSIVTSLTSGGAETLVANLSQEFSASGHESVVIALCDAATLGNAPEAEARLKAQIEDSGGTFVSLGLPASRKLLAGTVAMRRALRKIRPDVIHAHTARALLMMLAGKSGAPVVLTHHNSVLGFSPTLFRLFDRVASAYVAISRDTQTILGQYVRRPVVMIVNAAGRGFACDAPKAAPSSPLRILSVGTISDQKNYPLLIATAQAVRDRGLIDPLPEFLVAGNGADLGKLRDSVAAAGLQGQVQFLGERSDVRTLMQSADLYLNTSRYEGMPIALLEAMRMALPIVATDVAGNKELVIAGQTGLLEAEDPQALASAIQSLANDTGLYARLSQGALVRADEYSIGTAAAHHLKLYGSLSKSSNPEGPSYPKG
ncbi:MAG: glycosyltransferase family 4 protein [Novosphingobium sp.]|nr:glycosyltransferase family 4 protein [Novosphingobium sp.]